MNLSCKKTLNAAALTGAALLALGQPLQAATIYPIDFDPVYNAISATLSWRATTELVIPTLCASVVGTQTLNGGAASLPTLNTFSGVSDCAGIKLQNTQLQFFQTGNPGNVYDSLLIGDYLADVNGDSFGGLGIETQELFEVRFVGGVPVDLRSSMSSPLFASGVYAQFFAPASNAPAFFSLALGGTPEGVVLKNQSAIDLPAEPSGLYLGTEQGNMVRIRGLPEPGALTLVLAALAGLALSRLGRLRRAQRPA